MDYSSIADVISSYSSSSVSWDVSCTTPRSSWSSPPPPAPPTVAAAPSPSGVIWRRTGEVGPAVGSEDTQPGVMITPGPAAVASAAATTAAATAAVAATRRGVDDSDVAPTTPRSGGAGGHGTVSVGDAGLEVRAAVGGIDSTKDGNNLNLRSRKPHVSSVWVLLHQSL